MSIDVVNLGETKYINGLFYDSSDALADPTTVTLRITEPSGAVVEELYGGSPSAVDRTATGTYRRSTVFDQVGDWRWQWIGTGTVQDVEPGQCVVQGHGF